jgi:hypothetical protein
VPIDYIEQQVEHFVVTDLQSFLKNTRAPDFEDPEGFVIYNDSILIVSSSYSLAYKEDIDVMGYV